MMNCDKVKELLSTDYIDNEVDKELRLKIKAHLKGCKKCREFEEALKLTVVQPFDNAKRVEVPEGVWENVKERIGEGATRESVIGNLADLIKLRKPAFAMATAMALMLMAFLIVKTPFNGQKTVNTYLEEQADFLIYLGGENGDLSGDAEFGTGVEKYFL